MKRIASILTVVAVFGAMFAGCCPCRHLTTSTRDSMRVETDVRTERVLYTVLVEVPVEAIRQTVRDTTSHLETSFAVPDARILADGSLFHSLENKAKKRPISIEKEIVYRDSVVYRDRTDTKTIEVARPLTWWQQTQIRGFWMLVLILQVACRKQIAGVAKWLIQKIG